MKMKFVLVVLLYGICMNLGAMVSPTTSGENESKPLAVHRELGEEARAMMDAMLDQDIAQITDDVRGMVISSDTAILPRPVIDSIIIEYLFSPGLLRDKLIRLLFRLSVTEPTARILQTHDAWVTCFTSIDAKHVASADGGGNLVVWDLQTGKPVASFCNAGEANAITAIGSVSPETILYGCCDGKLYGFNWKEPRSYDIENYGSPITAITPIDTDRVVIASLDGKVRVLEWRTRVIYHTEVTGERIASVVAGDGGIYVCFKDGNNEFWRYDHEIGQLVRSRELVRLVSAQALGRGMFWACDGITGIDDFAAGLMPLDKSRAHGVPHADFLGLTLTRCASADYAFTRSAGVVAGFKAKVLRPGCIALVGKDKKTIVGFDVDLIIEQVAKSLNRDQRILLLQIALQGSLEFSPRERALFDTFSDHIRDVITKCILGERGSKHLRRASSGGDLERMVSYNSPTTSPGSSPNSSPVPRSRRLSTESPAAPVPRYLRSSRAQGLAGASPLLSSRGLAGAESL